MPSGDKLLWFGIGVAVGYFVAPMLLSKISGSNG